MKYAPIVLFVYNRLEHTKKTVEALKKNYGADKSEIYIYSDGAKEGSIDTVNEVRNYISKIDGFKKIHLIMREKNMGLAASVIAGVTEVINQHGRVIVMEDDLVTAKYFLRYMNEALQRYEDCSQVFAITGYSYFMNGNKKLPETYFARLTESWTWGTWKNRWNYFDPQAKGWEKLMKNQRLRKAFDYDNSFGFSRMLYQQMKERTIDSWAVRWAYTIFRQRGLTLYPNKSLCMNIGFDGTGTNCGTDKRWARSKLYGRVICYWPTEIVEKPVTRKQICWEMTKQKWRSLFNRIGYYVAHPIKALVKLING